jgi:fumarylacetoacetase
MTIAPDATHEPQLRSWVESSHRPDTDFPIQNLPYCVFRAPGHEPAVGVGIGDFVLDMQQVVAGDCLLKTTAPPPPAEALASLAGSDLKLVMGLRSEARQLLRQAISTLLRDDCRVLRDDRALRETALQPIDAVELCLPVTVGDYSDFYASLEHATNVGSMFRPENPLLPNYKWVPIGYHGRCSSIIPSGHTVCRPVGQMTPVDGHPPRFGPSEMLDYELEMGIWVAQQNELGSPIPMEQAEDYIFGMCLLNDWSARDLQKWEYQPLGPFLAKNFATTVSPWVVTSEALAPFRCPALVRAPGDPPPLPYLESPQNRELGGVDVTLQVFLRSAAMREAGIEAMRLSCASFRNLYWTPAQLIVHHTSNGCNLKPGDLLGSGTVSGPDRASRGCLLELTWDGDASHPVPGSQRTPIRLPTGEERRFLADGDEVTLRGFCQREGRRRIGFGACRGTIARAI